MKDKIFKKIRNERIKIYLKLYVIVVAILAALIFLGWLAL